MFKFLHLVLRNAARNRRRTFLTVLSLTSALVLFTFCDTIFTSWVHASDRVPESQRRLIVRNLSFSSFLPESHARFIESVPGVEIVHAWHLFDGRVKDREKEVFGNFAVDLDTFAAAWGEYKVSPDVFDAWKRNRQGCIVGQKLLDRFGWKVGQVVVLASEIYSTCEPTLVIVGTYSGGQDDEYLFFQRRYLVELLKDTPYEGRVGCFFVVVKDPEQLAPVVDAIDASLASSQAPTKSETESGFKQNVIALMGDVRDQITKVCYAALGVVLLVVMNTMAMAVRERTREVAVMKAIGFTPRLVVRLILAEGIVTALASGLIGCVGMRVLFENVLERPTVLKYFPNFSPSWSTVLTGLAIALAIGFLSAVIPALQAARIEVVAGLRRVG